MNVKIPMRVLFPFLLQSEAAHGQSQHRAQGMRETNSTVAEREKGDPPRTEGGEDDRQLSTETEEALRMEGAGDVKGRVLIHGAVPEFCFFLETALQTKNRRAL